MGQAFDTVAPTMDDVVLRNPINAWMRRVNGAYLANAMPPGGTLLDLGCGTAQDAIAMAERGHRVFALDISDAMVARARGKVKALGMEDRVAVVHGRMGELDAALGLSPWRVFQGGYANFSLTYEPALRPVAEGLYRALAPGAPFVCTLPNRIVLSELVIYGPRLMPSQALWRLHAPLMKDVHGELLEIHAYTPPEVRRAFADLFHLRRTVGIPALLPPVYLHQYFARLGPLRGVLERLDLRHGGRWPWNRLGEHTLYHLERLG